MPINPATPSIGARSESLPQNFPRLSAEVLNKYPELKRWDADLEVFWEQVKFVLSRQQEALQQQLDQTWSIPPAP